MKIEDTEDYFITDGELGRPMFGPKVSWRPAFAELMKSRGLKVLILSRGAGWLDADISFVASLDFLEGIIIRHWDIRDLSPLYELKNITHIHLECYNNIKFDFGKFNKLETCALLWSKRFVNIEQCENISYLYIDGFPWEDLSTLRAMNKIAKLKLMSRKLTSLSGIEVMSGIKKFTIHDCRALTDISPLAQCPNLETMEISLCKNLKFLPADFSSEKLTEVHLTNTGLIESLKPLLKCSAIETLDFVQDTNIVDGKIEYLLDLPLVKEIWFMNRPHYDIRREALKEKLLEKLN